MYRNLNPTVMGLACSHNELIELTLTHGFKGLHIEFDSFFEIVTSKGIDTAVRYLKSAPIKITSSDLPITWHRADDEFESEMQRLPKVLEMIRPLKCQCLVTDVSYGCDVRPYHENFEVQRQRLARIADAVAEFDMKLAINMRIPLEGDEEFSHPFVKKPDELVTLLKTCDSQNLALVVDAWQWTISGGTFELLSEVPVDRIVDVRIADLPADWNPNRVSAQDRLCYGETSAVNGTPLYQWLSESEYKGAITPFAGPASYEGMRSDASVKKAAASLEAFQTIPQPPSEEDAAEEVVEEANV